MLGPLGMMKGVFGEVSVTAVPEGSIGIDVAAGGPVGAKMWEE